MKKVVSVSQMRESDCVACEKIPSRELMYRAAMGIYNSVKWDGKILIACGYGNNAGDGFALATILKQNGHSPVLLILNRRFSEDGEYYFNKCKEMEIVHVAFKEKLSLRGFDIIVDCIFGTGFKGALEPNVKVLFEKINESSAYVVSADINSGLNADSGLCECCVKSDLTISIGDYKTGHFLGMAKDKIARALNVDIGIEIQGEPYYLVTREDASKLLFKRDNYSHKGKYGYVAIIGGSEEYSGAIKLSNLACSAIKSGAGVVKLASARSLRGAILPYLLESTYLPLSDENGQIKFVKEEIDDLLCGTHCVAIGMGMGKRCEGKEIIEYILKNYEGRVVIDADGLNFLSEMDASILKEAKAEVVLTPHLKEFERLLGVPVSEIEQKPIHYAKEYARKNGIILLLKGSSTIVTDGKDVFITDTGCAGMATAGSGDVLSGILCALLGSYEKRSLLESTYLGAYINGLAGELAMEEMGDISMCAGDTVNCIPSAIMEIKESY